MKLVIVMLVFWSLFTSMAIGQISPELQKAIDSVPFAKFDYPANRDRDARLNVQAPQAYFYAYKNLPYAIDLHINYDTKSGLYIEKVMLDYGSVRLSPSREKQILTRAIADLRALLDQQYRAAGQAGFYARYQSFSPSLIAAQAAHGNVMIAIRQIVTTQDLIHKLSERIQTL
jgi:hypothetical protein